jgi:kumamolisin
MTRKLVQLEGSVPVHKNKRIGDVAPHEHISVTVKLRRKSEDGLPTLEAFLAGKRSFMSRHDLEERHGARPADALAVQRWAGTSRLSVSNVNLGRRQMSLTGSADAMSAAFGVKLSMYTHTRTGKKFRCPEGDLRVPEDLAPIITGVFGLNNMPVAVRRRTHATPRTQSTDPKVQFPGSFYPNEVARLYNFPATQGSGQKVAVLEFGGGFDPIVLASYFKGSIDLQTAPTVNPISVLGTTMQVDDPATGEVYLDIEVVGAMAPKSTIDVYFAPWTGEGYLTAIDQAVHNDDYAAISISYGIDEDLRGSAGDPGWPMLNQNIDEAFRDATAVGIPVFVSSGDQGSSSVRGQVDQEEVTAFSPTAHTGYPASSPYATAVGGTMLYAQGVAISQEVVWNELGELQGNKYYLGGATGGGVSDRYKQVPSYQSGAGIAPRSANSPGGTGRGVPDVAGNAGASTGYLVSQPPGSPIPIAPVGGTSAAAPMWAALMACVRASLETTFNGPVPAFFFNDFVYANGKTSAFRDIVGGRAFTYDANGNGTAGAFLAVGSNRSTKVDGYQAQEGFDLCTGWGSPNGVELQNQLVQWLKSKPAS